MWATLSLLALLQSESGAQNCPDYPSFVRVGRQQQFFTTPNYPQAYPANTDCSLSLKAADTGNRLHVTVHDTELEDRLFTECPDYISIRDGALPMPDNSVCAGSSLSSLELARWCGLENPLSIAGHEDALLITFHSDFSIHRRGVNLSFVEYPIPGCPPGWKSPALPNDSAVTEFECYKTISLAHTQRGDPPWVEAQRLCAFEEADLFTADSQDELSAVSDLVKRQRLTPWIGYHDANNEGIFQGIDGNPPTFASALDVVDNEVGKDCVLLDTANKDKAATFVAADCRERHPVLCKRFKSGNQPVHPPLRDKIRKGYRSNASDLLFWVIIIIIILLLVCLLCFVAAQCKKKRGNQVGPIESVTKTPNNTAATTTGNGSKTPEIPPSRVLTPFPAKPSSPVALPIETKTASPRLEKEALLLQDAQNAARLAGSSPRTHPNTVPQEPAPAEASRFDTRNLPPLPVRETTYLSLKDPERSFLKTQRDGGLFDRPKMTVLDNVSAISLDEFWNTLK